MDTWQSSINERASSRFPVAGVKYNYGRKNFVDNISYTVAFTSS